MLIDVNGVLLMGLTMVNLIIDGWSRSIMMVMMLIVINRYLSLGTILTIYWPSFTIINSDEPGNHNEGFTVCILWAPPGLPGPSKAARPGEAQSHWTLVAVGPAQWVANQGPLGWAASAMFQLVGNQPGSQLVGNGWVRTHVVVGMTAKTAKNGIGSTGWD